MPLTNEDIATIMRLVRESSFDKLELTDGELSLRICSAAAIRAERQSVADAAAGTRPPAAAPEAGAPAPAQTTPPETAAPQAAAPQTAPPATAQPGTAGGTEGGAAGGTGAPAVVEAPSVGVFYVAPEPGAPPFVSPGDHVGADDAVGLLEAMKVFTTVYAGQAGTVLEILAENDTLVETGDPLIALRPDQ